MTNRNNKNIHVGIFRHSLYLPSEQFIPSQALNLPSAKVTMISRDLILNPVEHLNSASINDSGRVAVLSHTLLQDSRPLERLLRENCINVVHAHFGVEGIYSKKAATKLSIPHVVTLHGFDATLTRKSLLASKKPAWVYYSLFRQKLLTSDSYFVCVSRHIQKLAIELGADPARTIVIGTGVNIEHIRQSRVPSGPIILHVARLVEKKGTSILIKAFKNIHKQIPDAKLRIIGTGPLLGSLLQLVDQLELSEVVTFLGAQPHETVLKEIVHARVLALPSITAVSGDQEGLGQVLLEAGASGRPVVATAHGGILDGVIDGNTGFLVEERDHSSLAKALVTLLVDDDLAARMGREARTFVEQNFDVAVQSAKLQKFYELIKD